MSQRKHFLPAKLFRLAISAAVAGIFLSAALVARGQTNVAGVILTAEGTVEVLRADTTPWSSAATNLTLGFRDSLRTGPASRATVRLSDLSVLRVNEKTVLEIRAEDNAASLNLKSGSSYFFNRSKPSSFKFNTPLISGAIRGTEFNLAVEDDGRTTVTLIEGEVALNNTKGDLVLQSGEQGTVERDSAPKKTAVLNANNIIQWSLYYPAVLNPDELGLSDSEKSSLNDSLAAYRAGDLLAALNKFPASYKPASDAAILFHAALLLAVGQVEQTETELKSLHDSSKFADALRTVIAAVKHEEKTARQTPTTASGWLAESYYLQSRSKLVEALRAAHAAAKISPDFGFAWARVAELEFSFGHLAQSHSALERGLHLSPRHAQALTLQGFISLAENKSNDAAKFFDRAIAIDGALGNAWLGRGLCKIQQGHKEAGRQDIQVAATLEPNRSDLRGYLGKAWNETRDTKHAEKELGLAKQLDPNDPTPWLYSALVAYEFNRNNEAVSDLEKSKELNDNRSVYRSKFLLDQDDAVRGANLARLYRDVGMTDVSAREAAEAVNHDYANYSAHLFLANSYDALRDPKRVNLRYETPWLSELLVADLLAPVGAISLSQNISDQESVRLFGGNHVGLFSETEYFGHGDWVQNASEYGNYGNSGFALDQYYRSERGYRPNNDLEDLSLSAKFKQQLTPQDSLFLQIDYSDFSSGDVLQYYNQNAASRTLRIHETQEPNIFAGFHHEWQPGVHTLFLVGRLQDSFKQTDPAANVFVTTKNPAQNIVGVRQVPANLSYESDLEAYTAELQQIFQTSAHTLVAGARYQTGEIDTDSFVQRLRPVNQSFSPGLSRVNVYGYYSYQVFDPLQLTAGLSYDRLEYPQNNELVPVSGAETDRQQVSPKLGFRWEPFKNTTFRGVWSRSLGGVFYDTSVRLEPTQIAGFNQAFRSILPESVAGLIPGSQFENFGLAFDQKFPTRTYLTVIGEILKSRGSRRVGTLDAFGPLLLDVPSSVKQTLDFEEKSVSVVVNQLLGEQFAVGASYRVSEAELDDSVPAISPALSGNFSLSANRDVSATLHQANLYALFNHGSGFFSKVESVWSAQSNRGYAASLPGDDFWQFNAFVGYRFPRRFVEIRVGVLNITDRDYKLNPLNLYSELPRERTLFASLKFNF